MCGRREPASRRAAPRPRWRRVSSPARIPRRALGLRRCTWFPGRNAPVRGASRGRGWTRSWEGPSPWSQPRWCRPRRCGVRVGWPPGCSTTSRTSCWWPRTASGTATPPAPRSRSSTHRGPRPRWTSWTSCPTPRRWGLDVLQVSPFRRRLRTGVRDIQSLAEPLDRAARSVRAVVRRVVAVTTDPEPVPTALVDLVERLSSACALLAAERPLDDAVDALDAVARASATVPRSSLSGDGILAQVQITVIDLFQVAGPAAAPASAAPARRRTIRLTSVGGRSSSTWTRSGSTAAPPWPRTSRTWRMKGNKRSNGRSRP